MGDGEVDHRAAHPNRVRAGWKTCASRPSFVALRKGVREGPRPTRFRIEICISGPSALSGRGFESASRGGSKNRGAASDFAPRRRANATAIYLPCPA